MPHAARNNFPALLSRPNQPRNDRERAQRRWASSTNCMARRSSSVASTPAPRRTSRLSPMSDGVGSAGLMSIKKARLRLQVDRHKVLGPIPVRHSFVSIHAARRSFTLAG
jgi:hypothetical protein